MLTHRGPVRALAADHSGRYLVTAGADSQARPQPLPPRIRSHPPSRVLAALSDPLRPRVLCSAAPGEGVGREDVPAAPRLLQRHPGRVPLRLPARAPRPQLRQPRPGAPLAPPGISLRLCSFLRLTAHPQPARDLTTPVAPPLRPHSCAQNRCGRTPSPPRRRRRTSTTSRAAAARAWSSFASARTTTCSPSATPRGCRPFWCARAGGGGWAGASGQRRAHAPR